MRVQPSRYLKELTLLYVEDDKNVQEAFLPLVERHFKKVLVANNGEEGLTLFEKEGADIVISDIRMPKMDGLSMSEKIKRKDPQVFVLLLTAFSDTKYLMKALEIGVEGYLVKPIDRNKLFEKLNFFAEIIHYRKEQHNLNTLLRMLFDRYEDAIALFEGDTLSIANKKFFEYFGHVDSLEKFEQEIGKQLSQEHEIIQLVDPVRYFEVSFKRVGNFTIIILQDITFLQNELFVDGLTQAYNRKYFDLVIERLQGKRACMLFFDIDDFKKINDRYGHDIGDMVLQKIVEIVKRSLRQQDVLIRWGGEEFLILLDGVSDEEVAKRVGTSLVERVANTLFEKVGRVTISMGVGCFMMKDAKSYEEFFKALDNALYYAKRNGKNRVEVVD